MDPPLFLTIPSYLFYNISHTTCMILYIIMHYTIINQLMNQNYTVDQLALFIASNCHNYVAWDVLYLSEINQFHIQPMMLWHV